MPRGIRNVATDDSPPAPKRRRRRRRDTAGANPLDTAHDTSRGRNQSFGFTQQELKALSLMKHRGATWQTLNAIYGLL